MTSWDHSSCVTCPWLHFLSPGRGVLLSLRLACPCQPLALRSGEGNKEPAVSYLNAVMAANCLPRRRRRKPRSDTGAGGTAARCAVTCGGHLWWCHSSPGSHLPVSSFKLLGPLL